MEAKLRTASFDRKMELLQELYEGVAFHESGIMYSMQRLGADGIRPFVASDFDGQIGINPSVAKLQLAGPWDYLHGENSITASGLYLAAQSFRFEVTKSKAAAGNAGRAASPSWNPRPRNCRAIPPAPSSPRTTRSSWWTSTVRRCWS